MPIISFLEERIDLGIDYGATGGPEFSTSIVIVDSGYEQRNLNWSQERNSWELGERALNRTELNYINNFFRRTRGRGVGFRYKDWGDYKVTDAPITITGAASYQLQKLYDGANNAYLRDIRKPVAGTVTAKRNGSNLVGISVDTTTGMITLPADSSKNITAITKANPGVITATAHGFSNGNKIYLSGIVGMTQLNGQVVTATVVDANNFSIAVNTTNYTTYVNGGTAAKYAQGADVITWSGEFDVPVRFDADKLPRRFDVIRQSDGEVLYWLPSLPIVEIRV